MRKVRQYNLKWSSSFDAHSVQAPANPFHGCMWGNTMLCTAYDAKQISAIQEARHEGGDLTKSVERSVLTSKMYKERGHDLKIVFHLQVCRFNHVNRSPLEAFCMSLVLHTLRGTLRARCLDYAHRSACRVIVSAQWTSWSVRRLHQHCGTVYASDDIDGAKCACETIWLVAGPQRRMQTAPEWRVLSMA